MTVAEDLIAAANIMKERGRCVGRLIAEGGECCPLGAIGLATIPGFEYDPKYMDDEQRYVDLKEDRRSRAALLALAKQVPYAELDGNAQVAAGDIYHYNDGVAESDQEMIDTMLKAAKAANDKGM